MGKPSLKSLLRPQSIAVIGASADDKKVGGRTILFNKQFGYSGKIIPINPAKSEIQGYKAYPSISDVPDEVDLAILAIPSSRVVETVEECAAKGVKSLIIFSSGFRETGEAGQEVQDKIRLIGQQNSMRILGPNCIGFINVRDKVVGSFSGIMRMHFPLPGRVGLITQSGAVGAGLWDMGVDKGLGFSYWVSTGNEADVNVAECVEFMADDEKTDIIALQFEGTNSNSEDLRAALQHAFEKGKPVVVLRGASSEYGVKAAARHNGNPVVPDSVYDDMLKQTGAYRVHGLQDFFDVIYTMSQVTMPKGKNVGVFSVSGGGGILIADSLASKNLILPEPSPAAKQKMLELLPFSGVVNPVDVTTEIVGRPELLGQFLEICAEDEMKLDMIVVFLTYECVVPALAAQRQKTMIEFKEKYPHIPILVVSRFDGNSQKAFVEAQIPIFEDPEGAVNSIAAMGYFAEKYNLKTASL
jgi:Acyl-CoA synthetase (NDP forming)